MSLLNQMLKDLEQRSSSAPGFTFSDGVQSVQGAPALRPRTMVLSIAGLLLVLLASAAFWLGLRPAVTETLPAAQVRLEPEPLATLLGTAPDASAPTSATDQDNTADVAVVQPGVPTAEPPVPVPVPVPAPVPVPLETNVKAGVEAPARPPAPAPAPTPEPAAKPLPRVPTSSSLPPNAPVQHLASAQPSASPHPSDKTPIEAPPQLAASSSPPQVRKVASQTQRAGNVYRQALLQLQQGKEQDGILLLQQSIALQPDFPEARQTLAVTLLMQSRQQEAEAVLEDGLQRHPGHPGLSYLLARIRWEQGKLVDAHSMLDAALLLTPGDPQLHGLLALILQQQGRHPEAASHFLAALRSDPSMPSWLMGLARSWKNMGMNADAQEALERALQSKRLSGEVTTAVQQEIEQLR